MNVTLQSPGGSVWDGLAMYRALRDYPAKVLMRVPALAASMAASLMLAGDTIEVGPEAHVMIHNPMANLFQAEERDMLRAGDLLHRAKDAILNLYERRTGANREVLSEQMDAETWFIGEEVLEAGFAGKVMPDKPKMRIAACAVELLGQFKHPPESLLVGTPAALTPEVAERVRKLGAG